MVCRRRRPSRDFLPDGSNGDVVRVLAVDEVDHAERRPLGFGLRGRGSTVFTHREGGGSLR